MITNATFHRVPGMRVGRAAMLLAALVLAGCAHMDEDECLSADWRLIGYEDGAAGRSASTIGAHRESCAEYRVTPDMNAYREGREAGLEEYCRPQNAFQLGQAGSRYAGVCPTNLEADFRVAYDAGHRVYLARSRVQETQRRIYYKKRELASIREGYASMTNEMISNGTTTARRAELLVETTQSAQRQGELEDEVSALERVLAKQRRELDKVENKGQTW